MNILITGSSGQIGTNLGLALLARGESVLGVDKRANAWTGRFVTELAELHTSAGAQRLQSVAASFKPQVIVHLAAWAKVHQLVKEPEKAFENVAMMQGALLAARETGAAFVFGSSREVYGDVIRNLTHESMTDFVVAESPYSASKIAGEAFVSSFARCYRLPTLVFRFSNVYGRYDNDLARMERVIPLFVKNIWQEKAITVFGREKMLDFTYVDDCISGIIAGVDAASLTENRAARRARSNDKPFCLWRGAYAFSIWSRISNKPPPVKKARATYLPSQTGRSDPLRRRYHAKRAGAAAEILPAKLRCLRGSKGTWAGAGPAGSSPDRIIDFCMGALCRGRGFSSGGEGEVEVALGAGGAADAAQVVEEDFSQGVTDQQQDHESDGGLDVDVRLGADGERPCGDEFHEGNHGEFRCRGLSSR